MLHDDNPPSSLRDLCFSASLRREHHPHRLAVAARSRPELAEKLQAFLDDPLHPGIAGGAPGRAQSPGIVFVFSGNGPQWWGMGRQLLAQNPVFRAVIERCDQALRGLADWSLCEELARDEASSGMDRTDVAQPALFAIQIALAAVWASWGITPRAVVGHSVGEIAAAYVAGMLRFDDAIQVVFHRSGLQQQTAGHGKMVAVGLSADAMQPLLLPYGPRVSIGSINSPQSITLSGEVDALEEITAQLLERGIFCRFLKLDYAFHHRTMDVLQDDLLHALQDIQPQAGNIPYISTVTGALMDGSGCDAGYWWRNVREPVQFDAAIRHCIDSGQATFLEVGPHPVLSSYLTECLGEQPGHIIPSMRRNEDESLRMLDSLGAIYMSGADVSWAQVAPQGKRVALPLYPWQRERYWVETPSNQRLWTHPLLGERLSLAEPVWESHFDRHDLSYLRDHQVDGAALFPGAGYIELMLALATEVFGPGAHQLSQIDILHPLFLNDDSVLVQTTFSSDENRVKVSSRTPDGWSVHAGGTVAKRPSRPPVRVDLDAIRARCPREITGQAFYADCRRRGYQYGPAFQLAEHIFIGENEAIARILPPPQATEYRLHPALLDVCVHIIFSLVSADYLPISISRIHGAAMALPSAPIYSHVRIVEQGVRFLTADCRLLDQNGQVLLEISGLRTQAVSIGAHRAARELSEHCYEEAWFPVALQTPRRRAIPTPSDLAALVRPAVAQIDRQFSTDRLYQHALPLIHKLSLAYILNALSSLGWTPQAGESITASALIERLGILPKYRRLLQAWCLILADEGILSPGRDDLWSVRHTPPLPDIRLLEEMLLTEHPDHQLTARPLLRCGPRLAQMLSGQEDARTVLLGDSESGLPEHLYANGSLFQREHAILQTAIEQLVAHLPEGQALRILEVGPGAGASYLLPFLPADRTQYCFTDSSEVFLERARQKYRAYPFVEYQLLDLERDPLTQDLAAQSFDVVVATNVLHAATNLRRSLGSIHQLLAPQGIVCLTETMQPLLSLMYLTLGLLDEFWDFEDLELRPAVPLLTLPAWRDILEMGGFTDITGISPASQTHDPGLAILLAQRPFVAQSEQRVMATGKPMILFADRHGLAEQLAATLVASTVIWVRQGEAYRQDSPYRFVLRPRSREDFQRLFETLQRQDIEAGELVYLWGVDHRPNEPEPLQLKQVVDDGCVSLIYLVQELTTGREILPRLNIVTTGAAHSPDSTTTAQQELAALVQAPLRGLGRALVNEHPKLRPKIITLTAPAQAFGGFEAIEAQALAEELQSASIDDSEVWLSGAARWVNRIVRAPMQQSVRSDRLVTDATASFRLGATLPGSQQPVQLCATPRGTPEVGEIQIAVSAAALDPEDVGLDRAFGKECSGVIAALGSSVAGFRIGDEVIAFGENCISPFLITDARWVVRKPSGLNTDAAASIMRAFVTAAYALRDCAQLRQGERVLIHGAAGSVGLAAVQIIRQLGGDVFASATAPEQRAYLRASGIAQVFDAHSLTLVDDILLATDGSGVDIVLDAFIGEDTVQQAQLFEVLGPQGRFLEIVSSLKATSIFSPSRCDFSYFTIDFSHLIEKHRDQTNRRMNEIVDYFERGVYRPLPYETVLLSQINEAYSALRQTGTVGASLVSLQRHHAPVIQTPPQEPITFDADGSYLITGGVGGFGLETAHWLVKQGARCVILVSRSGKPTDEARRTIEAMQAAGASVHIEAVDVSKADAVTQMFERLKSTCPPLRGIVHAAMVLDDSLIQNLDEATWSAVLAPKMLGAWNLHQASTTLALDFFVLYSSIASLLGGDGTANYVAGNRFLDALTTYRRNQGLPALTLGWGPLQRVGLLARNAGLSDYLRSVGFVGMDHEPMLDLMGQCIQLQTRHKVIVIADWNVWNATQAPDSPARSRWAALLREQSMQTSSQDAGAASMTLSDLTPMARMEAVEQRLRQELGHLLRLAPQEISSDRTLLSLGVDSLMAVQLRTRLKQTLKMDVSVMQLLRPQPLTDLIIGIVKKLEEEHAALS